MGRKKELEVLPSRIVLEDGEMAEWTGLDNKKRERFEKQMVRQIEEQMGLYFESHLEEWERLIKKMQDHLL